LPARERQESAKGKKEMRVGQGEKIGQKNKLVFQSKWKKGLKHQRNKPQNFTQERGHMERAGGKVVKKSAALVKSKEIMTRKGVRRDALIDSHPRKRTAKNNKRTSWNKQLN